MELDRIEAKVWSGEPLDDGELSLLRRAASCDSGPRLRTTVAQALINADATLQAIEMLEGLSRDFPGDQATHLALGRALASVEKWAKARKALTRALELNPSDPEPKKALAALALREGEFDKAQHLVAQALEADTLDTEAQLLSSELSAASRAPSRPEPLPTLDGFVELLAAALRDQSAAFLLQNGALLLRLGRGGIARFCVDLLFREALEALEAPGTFGDAVTLLAKQLIEGSLEFPRGRLQLLARVLPVLRDSRFLDKAQGAVRREGPAGLWIFYALEDPEALLYIPQGLLAPQDIDLEELDAAAWKNLEARPTPVCPIALHEGVLQHSSTPTGLWAIARGDGHDAARLLTPSTRAAVEQALGPGPWRVFLGLRELVLLCSERDESAVRRLEQLEAAPLGIVGSHRLCDGRLCALQSETL